MALDIISTINLDLKRPNTETVYAVQYDTAGRIKAQLTNDGEAWHVPSSAGGMVSFRKSDNIGGFYDTTELGEVAVSVDENDDSVIYIALDAQTTITATPLDHPVQMQINFYNSQGKRLSTFAFYLRVQASVLFDGDQDERPVASEWTFRILTGALGQTIKNQEEAIKWMEDNIRTQAGYVVDDTLKVEGAAGDAKKIGELFEEIVKISDSMPGYFPTTDTARVGNTKYYTRRGTAPNYVYTEFTGATFKTGVTYYEYSPWNRIWIDPDDNDIEIPTMDEFDEVKSHITNTNKGKTTLNCTWEQGIFSGDTVNTNFKYRVSTDDKIPIVDDMHIYTDTGFEVYLIYYVGNTLDGYSGWQSGAYEVSRINNRDSFKISIRRLNEDQGEVADIALFTSKVATETEFEHEIVNAMKSANDAQDSANDAMAYAQKIDEYTIADSDAVWEIGGINSTTGQDLTSTTRTRSNYIPIKDLIYINPVIDKIMIFLYSYNKTYLGRYDANFLPTNTPITHDQIKTVNSEAEYMRVLIRSAVSPVAKTDVVIKKNRGVKNILPWIEKISDETDLKRRFDKQYIMVAYSTIGVAPINTKEHFMYCTQLGKFDALKCDCRVTSDNKIILCHDSGFTLDENGRITTFNANDNIDIYTLTYAQCIALEYATQYDGHYCHPCGLDDYLVICKRCGMIPFITVRGENGSSDHAALVNPLVVESVKKFGLEKDCIVNSFSIESLLAIRSLEPLIYLSQVFSPYNQTLVNGAIANAKANDSYLLSLFYSDGAHDYSSLITSTVAMGCIDTCVSMGIRFYGAQTATEEDNERLIALGFGGTQYKAVPTV